MNLLILKSIPVALMLATGLAIADSRAADSNEVKTETVAKANFTEVDADAAFTAYNKAFYVVADGKGHYKEDTTGGRNHFWTQAEEIEMILDVYERTRSPQTRQLIGESIAGFVDHFGKSWLSNKYNDDILWMTIACSRAYLATTNTTYLDLAKFHFDETYKRAWSDDLGGGLWWTTDNGAKNACVNGPGALAACYLYNILGDASYLKKAKAIYAWERGHLFDETSGAIHDNMRKDGRVGRRVFSYNTGTFIGAANFLSQLTGDQSYLADAEKAADYTRDELCKEGILPEYGGGDASGFNGIFVRWLARFATDNGRWPKYHEWMIQNANAAWANRRADNLGWNKWQRPTPDGVLHAWACADTVVILQVVPPESAGHQ